MVLSLEILTLAHVRAESGEGIRSNADTGPFLWLDLPESRKWKVDPYGNETALYLSDKAEFVCRTYNDRIPAGGVGGFWLGGPTSGPEGWLGQTVIPKQGAAHPGVRFPVFRNCSVKEEKPAGHMWILRKNLVRLPWTFTVFNGLAFSPCGTRICFAASLEPKTYAAAFEPPEGSPSDRGAFACVTEELGCPDGAVCDAAGGIRSANRNGDRCVPRHLPDGCIFGYTALLAKNPTVSAFRCQRVAVKTAGEAVETR